MNTTNHQNNTSQQPDLFHESPGKRAISYGQKIARLKDQITIRRGRLEKKQARAHYIVGKLVMRDPELWALVKPRIETELAKLDKMRGVVDEYESHQREICELKALGIG